MITINEKSEGKKVLTPNVTEVLHITIVTRLRITLHTKTREAHKNIMVRIKVYTIYNCLSRTHLMSASLRHYKKFSYFPKALVFQTFSDDIFLFKSINTDVTLHLR